MEQAHGMHTPMEIEKADSIAREAYVKELLLRTIALPDDIKRYIFQIMPRESHDEFIKRVKATTKKTIPDYYYYKNFQKTQFGKGGHSKMSIPTGLCPYNDHVAVLNGNHLQIINTHNHSIIHTENLPNLYYKNIALSCNLHTIATIHEERRDTKGFSNISPYDKSINVLTIKNRQTQKTESYNLSNLSPFFVMGDAHYPLPEFAFNEEGTHLILRGINAEQVTCSCEGIGSCDACKDMPHHLIIPVIINQHMHLLFSLVMGNNFPNNAHETSNESHTYVNEWGLFAPVVEILKSFLP